MKFANNDKLRRITLTGVLMALTTVATMLIRIPTPTKGYINLGDTIVNLSAWILGPAYGAAAGGIGSALADLLAGYTVYCPATLIIKALMAVAAFYVYELLTRKTNSIGARIASAVTAEIIMIVGYAVFEGFLYSSVAMAVASVTGNLVQGIFGAGASVALYEMISRYVPGHTK